MAENRKVYLPASILLIGFIAILLLPARQEPEVIKIRRECQTAISKERCYAAAFENLTKATDWNHSFEILRELQKIDPDSRGCHFIAHSITIAETEKDVSRWKEIMNAAPQDCSYGGPHGAIEVYASTFPDGKIPKEEIPEICNNPDTNNCTHILGHLLLIMNENDIPKSLRGCEGLPHNELGKFECQTGVFMERITAINLEAHGLVTKEALNWPARVPELEKLCREQSGAPAVACWQEIVHAVLVKVNNNIQKLVAFCESAPEEAQTRKCIDHSLGIIAASHNYDLYKMRTLCDAKVKAPNFQDRCYAMLVLSTLSTLPQEIESAKRFCSSIGKEYQSSCFRSVDNFVYHGKNNRRSDTIN